jgi:hypothetical protein
VDTAQQRRAREQDEEGGGQPEDRDVGPQGDAEGGGAGGDQRGDAEHQQHEGAGHELDRDQENSRDEPEQRDHTAECATPRCRRR